MSPVKVPQHLDLEDVLAWGLGAVDLLFLAIASVIAWWLWLNVSFMPLRVAAVAPAVVAGLLLGPGKFQEQAVRDWLVNLAAYRVRPRRRLYSSEA